MSNDKTDLLTRIAPPPAHSRISTKTSDNGIVRPNDLTHLYRVYGQGSFDIFLWIFAPDDDNSNLSSVHNTQVFLEALEETVSFDETVRPLLQTLREASTVTVWGGTDNGDQCLWLPPTSKAPERVIIVDSKCTEWATYKMSVTEFLHGVLTDTISCPIFPDDFQLTYADMQGVSAILGRPVSSTAHFFLTPEDSTIVYKNWNDIGPDWKAV